MSSKTVRRMAAIMSMLLFLPGAQAGPGESIIYEEEPNDTCLQAYQEENQIHADETHAGSLEWYYQGAGDTVDNWYLGYHEGGVTFKAHYASNTDRGADLAVWYNLDCAMYPQNCSWSDVGLSEHMECTFSTTAHQFLRVTNDDEGHMPYQIEFVKYEDPKEPPCEEGLNPVEAFLECGTLPVSIRA